MNTQSEADVSPRSNKLLIVEPPRNGSSIVQSAELAPWLAQGWSVIEASPRITEDGARVLVVLAREFILRDALALAPDKEPSYRRDLVREASVARAGATDSRLSREPVTASTM